MELLVRVGEDHLLVCQAVAAGDQEREGGLFGRLQANRLRPLRLGACSHAKTDHDAANGA
eukprot:7457157-Alexandrium_andersonii.AAC.1